MDATARLIARATRQHRLVTERDALRVMGPEAWQHAQDRGHWLEVAPGWFRHAATPLTFEMQVHAGSAWLGHRGALYGATALYWLGVEVDEPDRAEFLVPRGRRSVRRLVLHTTTRWDETDLIRHGGVRTCTGTRALIDFAAQCRRAAPLQEAIDSAIRLRRSALPRLHSRLAALGGSGRSGTELLREVLLDSGGESSLERRFLRLLRVHGFPRPDCQVVFRAGGVTAARVDFTFPGTRVIVEVSGRLGHTSDRDRQRDARRRNALTQAGSKVLEFTTADVIDAPDYVLSVLRSELLVTHRPRKPVVRV